MALPKALDFLITSSTNSKEKATAKAREARHSKRIPKRKKSRGQRRKSRGQGQ